jgi:hypothetical protein
VIAKRIAAGTQPGGVQGCADPQSAYLVQAKTQQGHEVVMMISPPNLVTSSTLPGNAATGSSGQMPPSMSGGSTGGGQNR